MPKARFQEKCFEVICNMTGNPIVGRPGTD